jgi:peptidyl-prolyl cis-trans isomerase SurA
MTKLKFLTVVGLILALVVLLGPPGRAEIIEQVLVKVNGEIFTKTQLETRQTMALRQSGEDLDPANDPTGERLAQLLAELLPNLIVSVVDEMLIVQHGKELGYRMDDEQFATILENLKKDNNLETDGAFEAALKQENMTMADLRQSLEQQMIVSRVRQNELTGIAVSEEEAQRYYASHLEEFTTQPTITLREIFVANPGEGTSSSMMTIAQTAERADQVHARALAGESFERLAADLSDSPSRANGGLIGPLDLGDLASDLREFIEEMEVGEISPVVRTPRGYQILKLESKTETKVTPFAEARTEVTDRVYSEKAQRQFETFLEGIRAQAIIDWKHPEIQKAYEQGLKALQAELAATQ